MPPSETVVLDSGNLPAIIADATGEAPMPEKPAPLAPRATKAEGGEKGAPAKEVAPDADGLTEEERKTYTEKMRKSVAWRHGKMREAQEQAQRERQGRTAAEERATALERELAQLRTQAPVQPRGAEAPKEPARADFGTDDEYIAARVKWDVGQELARERAEARKQAQQAERDRLLQGARERIARAIELVPDFEAVTSAADLQVPAHIAGYMQESDMFAELGYYFAKHPGDLERLSKLKPGASLVALGKIESTLQPFGGAPGSGKPQKVEPNGSSSKPSTAADGNPSRPRVSVPVIQPLNARGAPEVPTDESTASGRQAVVAYERRTGAHLSRRSRH